MLFIAQHAHQPLSSFNMDQHLNGAVRFHSSKLVAVPAAAKAEHISYEKRPALTATATATVGGAIDDISRSYKPTEEFNESVKVLFQQTGTYSSWVQLNTSGFLPNQRSHASFGIAVLQVSPAKLNLFCGAHVEDLNGCIELNLSMLVDGPEVVYACVPDSTRATRCVGSGLG